MESSFQPLEFTLDTSHKTKQTQYDLNFHNWLSSKIIKKISHFIAVQRKTIYYFKLITL